MRASARAWAWVALAVFLCAAAPRPESVKTPPRGEFAGKFELVPLYHRCKSKPGRCPIIRNGHAYYAVRNPFKLTTLAGDTVTIFGGQTTDLASVPKIVWNVLPPDGAWVRAAVPHDACYRSRGTFTFGKLQGRTRAAPYTRAECDEILRQGMVADEVATWKRVTIYEAVRIGGGRGWGS